MEIVFFKVRTREGIDTAEYERVFGRMLERVSSMPGFVGIEAFAGEDGSELAVARFDSADAVARWRDDAGHVEAQMQGREEFFDGYEIIVGEVWKQSTWSRTDGAEIA